MSKLSPICKLKLQIDIRSPLQSIVYSQALGVSWICSFEIKFDRHQNQMKSRFLKMGHPTWLIYTKVEMVKFR